MSDVPLYTTVPGARTAYPSARLPTYFNGRAVMVAGRLLDVDTGRPAWYGPSGEPATGAPDGARVVPWTMPDGRVAYYEPGNFRYDDPRRGANLPTGQEPGIDAYFNGQAVMVGGQLLDLHTGRPAWYGPGGEPGIGAAEGPYTTPYLMPDGRIAYYAPGSYAYDDPARGENRPSTGTGGDAGGGAGGSTGGGLVPTDGAGQARRQAQRDAMASLREWLGRYNLAPLADDLWTLILNDASDEEIVQTIRESPLHKARFPGMDDRRKAGFTPITEEEYLAYEDARRQLFTRYRMPTGFYDDPSDAARDIAQNKSLAELESRILNGFVAAQMAPPEVRQQLTRLYGVADGEGALAAFFMDYDRAEASLQKALAAASIGAASTRTGFGELTRPQAERLADLGVSPEDAARGFGELSDSAQLMAPLPGAEAAEETIGRDEQLGAVFEGNARARRKLRRQAERRFAEFQGGGGFSASETGITGLGEAT